MDLTAAAFLTRLEALPQPIGMGQVFALAKEFIGMPLDEIERLLEMKGRAGA
jgi:hypothetical protein